MSVTILKKLDKKSLTPLVKIDNDGYQDQLALNKDLKEQIHRCQVQLQTLLEVEETDNGALVEKLGDVKPPACYQRQWRRFGYFQSVNRSKIVSSYVGNNPFFVLLTCSDHLLML